MYNIWETYVFTLTGIVNVNLSISVHITIMLKTNDRLTTTNTTTIFIIIIITSTNIIIINNIIIIRFLILQLLR